jgi:hypothetical protein
LFTAQQFVSGCYFSHTQNNFFITTIWNQSYGMRVRNIVKLLSEQFYCLLVMSSTISVYVLLEISSSPAIIKNMCLSYKDTIVVMIQISLGIYKYLTLFNYFVVQVYLCENVCR